MVACFTSFERVACSEGDRFWEETTKFLAPIKQTKPKSHLVTGKKRCLSLSRSPYKVWHKREHLYQSFGNWQKMACYLVLKRPSKVLKPKPAGPSFVALWKLFLCAQQTLMLGSTICWWPLIRRWEQSQNFDHTECIYLFVLIMLGMSRKYVIPFTFHPFAFHIEENGMSKNLSKKYKTNSCIIN